MSYILTFSGKKFTPLNPQIEDICIEDIAHHLSNICRFTGATRSFYSVAQHSIMVAEMIGMMNYSDKMKLQLQQFALLHDASEAYLCDIARPLKYSGLFDEYLIIEKKLQDMIYQKFCDSVPYPKERNIISNFDNLALEREGKHLIKNWECLNIGEGIIEIFEKLYLTPIKLMTFTQAKEMFLRHYRHLFGVI
mgnify:CR=1 FL=1